MPTNPPTERPDAADSVNGDNLGLGLVGNNSPFASLVSAGTDASVSKDGSCDAAPVGRSSGGTVILLDTGLNGSAGGGSLANPPTGPRLCPDRASISEIHRQTCRTGYTPFALDPSQPAIIARFAGACRPRTRRRHGSDRRIRSGGNKTRFDIAGRYGLSQEMIVPWLENQSRIWLGLADQPNRVVSHIRIETIALHTTFVTSGPLSPGHAVEWKGRRINEINEIGPERLEQTSLTAKAVGSPALHPAYSPHPSPTTRRPYQNTGCRRFTPPSATVPQRRFVPSLCLSARQPFPNAFLSSCAETIA